MTEGIGYAAAIILALVFGVAAVSKLIDPVRTAESFEAMDLPAPRQLARAVPAGELLVAVSLAAVPIAGAILALVALIGFTLVIWSNLQKGDRPACSCFGSARSEPISFVELVRNAMLTGLAVAAFWATGPVVPSLEDILLVIGVGALGLIVLALLRMGQNVGHVWATPMPGEDMARDSQAQR